MTLIELRGTLCEVTVVCFSTPLATDRYWAIETGDRKLVLILSPSSKKLNQAVSSDFFPLQIDTRHTVMSVKAALFSLSYTCGALRVIFASAGQNGRQCGAKVLNSCRPSLPSRELTRR